MRNGGRFALSDDSHGPDAVGLNYHRLADYLHHVGVTELWYLESYPSSVDSHKAGRANRPCRLAGNWWEHNYWKGDNTATASAMDSALESPLLVDKVGKFTD